MSSQSTDPDQRWSVYVLRCHGDRLYTGICVDLERRLAQHRSGRGAKFTRAHPPQELMGTRAGLSRSQALRLEATIKRTPRHAKLGALAQALV